MFSVNVSVPATPGTLGAATSMARFQFAQPVSAQLPSSAQTADRVKFYGGNISNATSIEQLDEIPGLNIPDADADGRKPSNAATVPYLYLYAYRVAGTSGALTANIVGTTELSPDLSRAILQDGNAFGTTMVIGTTDGKNVQISSDLNGSGAPSEITILADPTSNASSTITIDGGLDTSINIGANGVGEKVVYIGSLGGTNQVNVQGGQGGINLRTQNSGGITIQADGSAAVTVEAGTGGIAIGAGGVDQSVGVGFGAGVKTTTIGSTHTTSSTTVQGGTGGVAVSSGGDVALTSGGSGYVKSNGNSVSTAKARWCVEASLTNNATQYFPMCGSTASLTPVTEQMVGEASTITTLHLEFTGNVGSAPTVQFAVTKNGTITALVTINILTGSGTHTATVSVAPITLAATDKLGLQMIPSNTLTAGALTKISAVVN